MKKEINKPEKRNTDKIFSIAAIILFVLGLICIIIGVLSNCIGCYNDSTSEISTKLGLLFFLFAFIFGLLILISPFFKIIKYNIRKR